MSSGTVIWKGFSGQTYGYNVYRLGSTAWRDLPGNYIFAKQVGQDWRAIYIGQTESFRDRLPGHNELPCVSRNGATHIHVHVNRYKDARLSEERDLILEHKPACNQQHKAA